MLVYMGNSERTYRDMHEHRTDIEQAFAGMLDERYDEMRSLSDSLLVPEAFTAEDMECQTGGCAFMVEMNGYDSCGFFRDGNGNLQRAGSGILRTSPRLILTDEGIDSLKKESKIYGVPLVPLTRGFAQFIMYCIQDAPMDMAARLAYSATGCPPLTGMLHDHMADISEIFGDAMVSEVYERAGNGDVYAFFRDFYRNSPEKMIPFEAVKNGLEKGNLDMIENWDRSPMVNAFHEAERDFIENMREAVDVRRTPVTEMEPGSFWRERFPQKRPLPPE